MRQSWIITSVAGAGTPGYTGDGGPAERAHLNGPFDLTFDTAGNLYFSDTFNHRVRRIEARSGTIATVAGCGEPGYAGDGGPASAAQLNEPYGIALDDTGNLYIADRHNHCVRRVDPTGLITSVAGSGEAGFAGDGGPAAAARLVEPNGLAFDARRRRLLIADVADHRVRAVDLASGIITTFAGTGAPEHGGDGTPAAEARIHGARAVAVAPDGTVYILERQGSTLRRVDPDSGVIATIAGTGGRGYSGDGGPAAAAVFDAPKEMALDRDGNLLIVDTENHAIRFIDLSLRTIVTIAGGRQGSGGDGGPAEAAGLDRPHGAACGPDGAIYIGDTNNHRIRKLTQA